MSRPPRAASALLPLALLLALAAPRALAQGAPPPASSDERLDRLEKRLAEQDRKIDDQQREIEALRARGPAAATRTARAEEQRKHARDVVGGTDADHGQGAGLEWGYKDGFFLRGESDGFPYEIRPRGRIQVDYRQFPTESQPRDQWVLRRLRLGFEGRVAMFGYLFEVDPTRGQSNDTSGLALLPLGDFWAQWRQYDVANVRIGHYRTPWSFESGMTGDLYLDTLERSMFIGSGNSLAPDFRPGAEILGFVGGDGRDKGPAFRYWLSAQNQHDSSTQLEDDGLYCSRLELAAMDMALGGAGIWNRAGNRASRSIAGQTPGQYTWFPAVAIHGWSQRYEGDLTFIRGPFWVQTEYAWGRQDRDEVTATGADGAPLIVQGWYALLGWKFWGPPAGEPGPHVPFQNWQLASMELSHLRNQRQAGMEAVVKVEWMDCADGGGGTGLPVQGVPTASRFVEQAAKALTLGLNLDLIENARLMFDWVHIRFDHEALAEREGRKDADEFMLRFQLEF